MDLGSFIQATCYHQKCSKMLKYLIDNRPSAVKPLSKLEYNNDLCLNKEKAKLAFEKAWATRNFEIELYWKRANYFWAFIASALVGFFALINSANYTKPDTSNHVEVYIVICIGIVLSVAWLLINIGSKAWQRNWEVHVDLLEDSITGPLYKTVFPTKTYSVSKINEIVSPAFVGVWILLAVKYFNDQDLINFENYKVNWLVVVATAGVCVAITSMVFGHGRGRFSEREVTMNRRASNYHNP